MRILATIALLGACTTTGGGPDARTPGPDAPPPADGPDGVRWFDEVELPAALARPSAETEAALAGNARDLCSDDFATYSAAARRLVATGPVAVPYLGHLAVHGPFPALDKRGRIVVARILADAAPEFVGLLLRSPYPLVRAVAAGVCGERELAEHAALLVGLLDDPELSVRRAGVTALRRLAERFYGYRADASAANRADAIARWREHVAAG